MGEEVFFNGIDGSTGGYLLDPLDVDVLAAAISGAERNPDDEKKLKDWWGNRNLKHYAAQEGTDYKDLASTGWAVIFPYDVDPAIPKALKPLLDWRKSQAGQRYKEYSGPEGYRYKPGEMYESKEDWLTRHNAAAWGAVNQDFVPYNVLLAGSPEQIPYRFQTQLDVQYGVGRIHFDKAEDYWNYANSVVSAEKQKLSLGKTASFFAVCNPDDPATNLSTEQLVRPLAASLSGQAGWKFSTTAAEDAVKKNLERVLGGEDTPALLFTASHGMGFPDGHERQALDQGALLCQDWPGPKQWRKPIGNDFYFSADDLTDDSNVFGLVAFFFACYGAGTPRMDDFSRQAFKKREEIAPRDFLARLPQRMLAHPKGGALAVIGHVERAWGYSFSEGKDGAQVTVFKSALKALLDGFPIGYAFEYFNSRYAELSSDLTAALDDAEFGKVIPPADLARKWTANNDARNYVVLGDPAVRLMA